MARLFARIAALVLGISAFAGANAQTYTYTFYVGNTNATGCTVSTPAGPVEHVKWRLQATVTAGVSPQFGSVSRADCSGGVFGSPTAVASTSAIGLNTGTGGADVIEVQLPVGVVGPTPSPREVLAAVASSNSASDALIATAFTKGVIVTPPALIPSLGLIGAVLLGLALLALGGYALRRYAPLLPLSLLLVAGAAWAVSIVIDGQVGDWATVTPSSDAVGDVSESGIDLVSLYVTTQGGDGYLRVDVADLQNPPVANPGSANLLEDGSTTITLTGSDPGGAPLTFQIATPPTRGSLGPITPIDATSASVLYTANADEFGADSFSFTVNNGAQTSAPATVAIAITPVNDAPSFAAVDPPSVNEGSGAHTVPGWASFNPGPANESGQVALEYLISGISNPALFSIAPAVDANGTLSYTLAAQVNGSSSFTVAVRDDGGTASGGVDLSAAQSFTVSVNAVNGAPSFIGGGDVSALEDAGAQTVTGWATAIDDGDPEQTQGLTFSLSANSNPALFAAGPSVDPLTGNLSYTPAADANGTAALTLVLSDDGGVANGGNDSSAPYSFNVQITPVNDAPSFTAIDPPAVNENSGTQSVPNWAAFDPGPANESGQAVVEYLVSAIGNPALFAVAPSVAANGTLTYTVAPNVSGSSTFSVAVRDDGGVANGGVDLSASQVFTIMVNAVNSAPSFIGGGDVTSDEDAGPQSFAAWATAIDDGDPEAQTLTFNVTGNTNPTLFAAGPAVDAGSGNLSYAAAANASGSATITLTLSDDGGTANGGDDTSAPYSFTITVNPVNDAPTATAKAHTTHSAIELEIVAANHTGELLEGAVDVDDPVGDLTAVYVAGSATPAGAQVTVTNASDGSFRYDPPGGASGAGSFQFQICDDGVPTAPQQCSAATTVTFTITGPELYFVDDSAGATGDGGLNDPFDALSDIPAGRGTGDRIYVFEGSYATAHSLNADEHLIGQGHSGSSTTHLGVVAVGNGVLDTTPAAGVAPTLGNTITFGGNNGLLRGVAISSGANTGVVAGAVTGITVLESSVTATTTAVNFNGTDASAAGVNFTSTTSSGGVNGVVLNNVTDTFDFGTGALSGHTGVSFLGTGTLGTTSYAGTISKTSAGNIVEFSGAAAGTATLSGNLTCNAGCAGIDVLNRGAGTITFSGTTKTLNTAANTAVNLDNNDAATIHFTGGGLDIDTTSGTGFNAVAGATAVSVQGTTNTIDSVNGVGLNIAGTDIGEPDVTFEHISSGAGANVGISLDGTGTAGNLVVTGTGTPGSGGTITNKTGADGSTSAGVGVYLNNTADVVLHWMQLNDFQNSGIVGRSVTGFTLTDSVISGVNGTNTSLVEGALNFGLTNPGGTNGLQGTGLIRNTHISGAIEHNLEFYNQSGAMTLTIEGGSAVSEGTNPNSPADDVADCIIEENSATSGADGIQIEMQGSATANIRVDRCLFRDNKSQSIQVTATDSSDIILAIEESRMRRFDQGIEGVVLSNGINADLTTRVSDNHFNGLGGTSIFVGQTPGNASAAADLDATVTGNVVNQPTTATNHGIIGFMTSTVGQVSLARLNVSNNTVVNNSTSGMARGVLVDTPDALTSPDFDATVSSNSVAVADNVTGVTGLVVQGRQSSNACTVIDTNTVTFPNGTPAGVMGVRARRVAPAVDNMEQSAACTGTAAAVLACRNPASTTEVLGTINVVAAGTCQTPVVVP